MVPRRTTPCRTCSSKQHQHQQQHQVQHHQLHVKKTKHHHLNGSKLQQLIFPEGTCYKQQGCGGSNKRLQHQLHCPCLRLHQPPTTSETHWGNWAGKTWHLRRWVPWWHSQLTPRHSWAWMCTPPVVYILFKVGHLNNILIFMIITVIMCISGTQLWVRVISTK